LFKSNLTTPLRLDFETSPDFGRGCLEKSESGSSRLGVNDAPTSAGVRSHQVSDRSESAELFSHPSVEADASSKFSPATIQRLVPLTFPATPARFGSHLSGVEATI